MTNKELRKLSRAELIDILFELQTQNENLTAENRELAAQLESRQLQITEAGSIAEAALRLNGVFEAAQAAADQYVRCTKDSLAIAERTLAAAKRQADTLVQEATAQAQKLLADADARLKSSWSQFLLDDSAQQTKNGE
jgi:cell division septum initiation protein DivIVA